MGSQTDSSTFLSLQDQIAFLEQQCKLLPEANRQEAQQALNDLRQAIDNYIQFEVEKVLHLSQAEDFNSEETPF
jgi:vacuolar-type H+-ATPase subunit E/Vma4